MYVYGGYSQRCGDYCDDLWAFDVEFKTWQLVYPSGKLSHLYSENTDFGEVAYSPINVPRDNLTRPWAGNIIYYV